MTIKNINDQLIENIVRKYNLSNDIDEEELEDLMCWEVCDCENKLACDCYEKCIQGLV
ncbi:MAG: hypothetical protein GXO26_08130 [Crenarchaeota archaeon]|nr:hypothetical protein [Thermoproteota archaeon]